MCFNNVTNRLYLHLSSAAAGAVQSADPGTVPGADHQSLSSSESHWRQPEFPEKISVIISAPRWFVKLPDLNAATNERLYSLITIIKKQILVRILVLFVSSILSCLI